jgi:hypothetical protein
MTQTDKKKPSEKLAKQLASSVRRPGSAESVQASVAIPSSPVSAAPTQSDTGDRPEPVVSVYSLGGLRWPD